MACDEHGTRHDTTTAVSWELSYYIPLEPASQQASKPACIQLMLIMADHRGGIAV